MELRSSKTDVVFIFFRLSTGLSVYLPQISFLSEWLPTRKKHEIYEHLRNCYRLPLLMFPLHRANEPRLPSLCSEIIVFNKDENLKMRHIN